MRHYDVYGINGLVNLLVRKPESGARSKPDEHDVAYKMEEHMSKVAIDAARGLPDLARLIGKEYGLELKLDDEVKWTEEYYGKIADGPRD